jgi:hypothetical protein
MSLLVNVEELKAYMSMSGQGNSAQTESMEAALYWAQAALWAHSDYCERADVTEELHDSTPVLIPRKLPIINVTSLYYDDALLDDYYVYDTYIRVPSIRTIGTPQKFSLNYTGGVSRDDVTDPIDTSTIGYKYTIQAQMTIKRLAEWALSKNYDYQQNSKDDIEVLNMIYSHMPKVIRI